MKELIDQLIQEGYLKTQSIIEAFREIKREDFLPDDLKSEAMINAPLPIGYGQTNSQPLTVAFMLELLQPQPGDRILDIGAGSGWQTAMLAYIVGSSGKIYAIERILELVEFAKKNIAKYNFLEKNIVEVVCDDGSRGLEKNAPYNKIIAAASAEEIPDEWKEQLKVGGRIVAPVRESILLLIKNQDESFEKQEFPGFAFVPLIYGK